MAKDLTMSVDDQMLVCLEVMARGEDMLALGVWEAPLKRLAMRDFAVKVGNGYRITDKGRAFFAKEEGVDLAEVQALAPTLPTWIIQPLDGALIVLRRNDLAVSGYEALQPQATAIVHNQMNGAETAFMLGEYDDFLQAMLDAAWAKGLRPTTP